MQKAEAKLWYAIAAMVVIAAALQSAGVRIDLRRRRQEAIFRQNREVLPIRRTMRNRKRCATSPSIR